MLTTLRRLSVLLALAVPLALAGCGTSLEAAREAAGTVNGLCPVREEPVVKWTYVDHDGQRIGFCCAPCKPQFLKDPESFLNKLRSQREKFAYTGK